MRYLSVCSGIEAATVAWHELGWEAAAFSEIEKFPRDVLQFHYPNTPLHGDFTTIGELDYGSIDILVGGTPCQSFSIAGLRAGLSDERGNLALEFLRLAKRKKPRYILWENVPGVLSSNKGKDFGAFLGGMGELGYGFAYRVLDAQYFGVPQRRRRVFVVGCVGDWRSAAKVLFEPESLQGNITPCRKTGAKIAGTLTRGLGDRGIDADQITNRNYAIGDCFDNSVVGALCRRDYKGLGNQDISTGRTLYCNSYGMQGNIIGRKAENGGNGSGVSAELCETLTKTDNHAVASHVFKERGRCEGGGKGHLGQDDLSYTLSTKNDQSAHCNKIVRRLTPLECERLQGFPDNYTNIPNASDAKRYKSLGNSMAVPVMKWIGERIQLVDNINQQKQS